MGDAATPGVGPHPQPWPDDPRYDRDLLAGGDQRNVIEKYRYWKVAAIKADLDASRLPLEIAVENVERDFNMGTIIRNANAFNVNKVHIIGRRQWNKRGAMATDLYMNIEYHSSVDAFVTAAREAQKKIIAVDIVEEAEDISEVQMPQQAILVFGAEGPGLSQDVLAAADRVVKIEQLGSTRSINVGVASGIAIYMWLLQHSLTR